MFLKEPSLSYLFIIWRTFFHHKEPFVKQKDSSDVKGSSWNHIDKKMSSMASWSTFIFKSVTFCWCSWKNVCSQLREHCLKMLVKVLRMLPVSWGCDLWTNDSLKGHRMPISTSWYDSLGFPWNVRNILWLKFLKVCVKQHPFNLVKNSYVHSKLFRCMSLKMIMSYCSLQTGCMLSLKN